MHEWSLADAVVMSVDSYFKKHKAKEVKSVNLLVGELQNIDLEVFNQGLLILLSRFPFKQDVFHIEIEKASFCCHYCKRSWFLDEYADIDAGEKEAIHFLPESAHVYMRCPGCGSSDFKINRGRGVSIQSIVLVTDDKEETVD